MEEAGCPKKFITEKCVFLATIDKLNVQYDTIEGFTDIYYQFYLHPYFMFSDILSLFAHFSIRKYV